MTAAHPLQAEYQARRRAWAEEIGRPIPKRRKTYAHPPPVPGEDVATDSPHDYIADE